MHEEGDTRHNLPIFPTSDRTMSLGQGSLFDKKQEFNILEKLKQLRDNKVYCDVVLVVKGVKLEAHKNVLAAWSPYFATRLFPDKSDVFKDTILVNYESSEVFADLLDFMYNGYVAPRETNFLQLLHLAVSFQIEMLKNYCEEFLRCNLHLGNFVSTYFLSRKYKLDSLEEYIVGFLQLNLSDAVKQGEFLSLTARKFNTLLSKGWMEQIKPEIKLFLIISWVGYDVQEREKFLVLLLGHIDWSAVANDFLLEISRTENFFTSHESSLYLLLQTLYSAGIPIGPYTKTFPSLRETHEHILNEVVDTSLLQIEIEPFYPATIVVLGRPGHKDQCINTNPCKEIDKGHVDVRNASMNTDVNSEHFEKEAEEEAKCSTIITEPYHEEPRTDHHEVVGTLMIESNAQEFDDVGKYIEAELNEMNRKSLEQVSKETVETSQTNQEEIEETVPASVTKSPRRRKAVRGGAGRRARKTKVKEEEMNKISSQADDSFENKENSENDIKDVENGFVVKVSETKHTVSERRSVRKTKRVVNNKTQFIDDTNCEDFNSKQLVNDRKQLIYEQQENSEEVVDNIHSYLDEDSDDSLIDKTYEPIHEEDKTETGMDKLKKSYQRFINKGRKRKYKQFTCTEPDCKYKTTVQGRLERHIDREHERAIDLKCNICMYTTKCVRTFNNHMREHIPGPPFKCDEPRCTYRWVQRTVLILYMVMCVLSTQICEFQCFFYQTVYQAVQSPIGPTVSFFAYGEPASPNRTSKQYSAAVAFKNLLLFLLHFF